MAYCPVNTINILNGSNLKHVISFVLIINGTKYPFAIDNINMTATYSITNGTKTFISSKTGLILSHCILDEDNLIIKVIFEDYDLENGIMICKLDFTIPDTEFPDQLYNMTKVFNLGANLISLDLMILQDLLKYNKIQIDNDIKTEIIVKRIIGNSSTYDIKYPYIYTL